MFIPIRDLIRQGRAMDIQQSVDIREALSEHPSVLASDVVRIDLQAVPSFDAVKVSGRLMLNMECACSRCLVSFREDVSIPFEETFSLEVPSSSEGEVNEEDSDIHYITDDKVDLMPYIVENVWLGLPFIPICGESCKGLCPVCGTNRNEHSCECQIVKVDPRLAGLQAFFEQDNKGK